MKQWLTKKDVANRLNVSIATLDRMMKKKLIPFYKLGKNRSCRVLFSKKDVDSFVLSNK